MRPPFHLAFPVPSLEEARAFFCDQIGCSEGRSAERWVDFDFFGHQISAHLVDQVDLSTETNRVDGDAVPTRHFGLILPWGQWERLADQLRSHGVHFIIEPRVRFAGQAGEQGTFFVQGPGDNVLEFKTFRDEASIYAV